MIMSRATDFPIPPRFGGAPLQFVPQPFLNIRAEWLHFILRSLLTRNFSKFLCFAGGKSGLFESFGQRRRISFDNIQRHCGSRVGMNICHIAVENLLYQMLNILLFSRSDCAGPFAQQKFPQLLELAFLASEKSPNALALTAC